MDILHFAVNDSDDDSLAYLYLSTMRERKTRKLFDINRYSREDCISNFRFDAADISRMINLFQFPASIKTASGNRCETEEAFCILLRRLAYPNRLFDMQKVFDKETSVLSEIANCFMQLLFDKYSSKLNSWDQEWLQPECLQHYCDSISKKGAPLRNCFGFIDGTIRPMCRPSKNQSIVYNGHKRLHGLKYQSVVIPNGLISNLFGPIEGRKHDSSMLDDSQLLPELERNNFLSIHGDPFCVYGDPAYGVRPHIIAPFKAAALTREQIEFNKAMSMSRITVEWQFGKVATLFAFGDYKNNQKLYVQAIGTQYLVSVLLTNMHTCIYGSQTSKYFDCKPPSLEVYLG